VHTRTAETWLSPASLLTLGLDWSPGTSVTSGFCGSRSAESRLVAGQLIPSELADSHRRTSSISTFGNP
jgi:hypothetical protein